MIDLARIAGRTDVLLTRIAACMDALFPKIARQVNLFLDLVGGPVVGALMLYTGIKTYRHGGSVGWPIAGSVLLLANLWGAWRRLSRLRKHATSQPSQPSRP
ncbi:hypothetical protein AB0F77_27975 [Streptomyces sp. NPDC026672]|uniref:hypothetical protein n=1 Tax=unclassified Streptomyces TaxID=2593676 RepID=UPI0033E2DD67